MKSLLKISKRVRNHNFINTSIDVNENHVVSEGYVPFKTRKQTEFIPLLYILSSRIHNEPRLKDMHLEYDPPAKRKEKNKTKS